MKKIVFVAAIAMASVFAFTSCNQQKGDSASKMEETPVAGTDFSICKTTDGLYGVKKGDKVVINPEYMSIAFSNNMFIAHRHLELWGVVTDDQALISPSDGNVKLTGDTIQLIDGNFVSKTGAKKAIYVTKSKHSFAQLDDYALSEKDDMIVTEMEGALGVLSLKRDTLIEATKDYSKLILLKGERKLLGFTEGAWYTITFSKGEILATPLGAAELKKFKKKDGWTDQRKVFAL